VTQRSLQTLPQVVDCNEPFSIKGYLETSVSPPYAEISDFAYQLSTVTKSNRLVLLFFVGYGTMAAFVVVVSAWLFIGCVSLGTISSLEFFHCYSAQSTGINSLLEKCCVF